MLTTGGHTEAIHPHDHVRWRRKTGRLALAVSLALVLLLSPAATARAAEPPAGGMSAAALNAAFAAYGDSSGRWNGGDSTASVQLPDGRVVWLFSDTFVGPVNADGSRPAFQPMIHNSIVVQDGAALTETLTGGTAEGPASLVGGERDGDPANAGYWVADGTVEGTTLQVLYNHYRRTGTHPLDVALDGTSLASFDLPGLALRSLTPLPLGSRIAWGSAILEDGDTTYVYGTSLRNDAGPVKSVYLAKVAAGQLAGAWQFWTGTGWSDRESDAGRLMGGVTTAFGVQKVGGEYVLITVDGNLVFNSEVVAYTAPSPTGPFTGPVHLFRAPEPQPGREIIVYDARFHPELARSGKLLVSYNLNSLAAGDNQTDAGLYRPRFVEVDWPRPAPDPATLPPVPAGLAVTADEQRNAQLTWTASAGATAYRVYRRDVSYGQSHPVRLPNDLPAPSFTDAGLVDGHLYEFSIAAVNANGESARSAPVAVTARGGPTQEGTFQTAPEGTAIAGSYLVDLRDNAAAGEYGIREIAGRLVARYGGTLESVYSAVLGGFSMTGLTDAQARQLATDPAVEAVEEDQQAELDGATTGGVQQSPPSWGLDRIDGTPDGRYVYPSTGAGVNVYVVDTGVRITHEDFGGRAEHGFSVLPRPDPDLCAAHGTHAAGIAGGSSYGVAKQSEVVDVQVGCRELPEYSVARITAGVNWVVENASQPAVMNMSLSVRRPSRDRDSLAKAVREAVQKNVTVVAAAGNQGEDSCDRIPASIPEVITVAATQQGDRRWPDSNFGSCVDLFAPGANITSAGHTQDDGPSTGSGTSAAAPHVAGAAALVLQAHRTYQPKQVADALIGQAEQGVVTDPGVGTPNRLLRVAPPLAEAPTGLTASPADDGTINLAWQPVDADGVSYRVSQRDVTAGQPDLTPWDTDVYSGTTAVAKNLVPGHTYEFTVAAVNTMAVSPPSNVATAKSTIAPPPAPGGLTATAQGNGTIKLTWTEPQPDVWYWVYQRDVTADEQEFTKLPLPITECCQMEAGFLVHGHTYEFKVSATNRGGEGPASAPASATVFFDAPAPPTNLRAAPGDGRATLTWDPSPTPDVWYWVYQRDATENEEWQQLPLPISDCCTMPAQFLTNGHDYEFKVTATRGSESVASNVVRVKPMPAKPGKPTNLRLQPLPTGEITLTWDAPGPDLYYRVYWRDVTAGETSFRRSDVPTDATTATWGFLTHQHVYEFKVTGENLAGEGPASDPAQAKSQVALPKAPTNLRASAAGSLEIALSWDAPGPNVLYWVYWRDVTAGETTFRKSQYPTDRTEATWQYLTNQHVYEFKVSATNVAGEGPASATARATAVGIAPQPPTNLNATPGDGAVRLTWTASPTAGVDYVVYLRDTTKGQSWQKLPYPVGSCCTFTAQYLTNGDTYEFKVAATNAGGESKPSNVATAKPMPPFPQPPTNLRATAGDGEVRLAWSASPTPNVYYWIEYRKAGGSWTRLKYPLSTCCTFTVGYLNNGTTYEFRARATNVAGDSSPSNTDSARPMPPFPQPPSNLSATAAGDGKVKLTWSASPTRNVYYWIEYRKAGGSWIRLEYPVTTCCSFTVKYLTNGVTYEFRVRATNLAGTSAASNTDSARPMPPFPQPPTNLRGTAGDSQVKLTWSASPTPNVLYNVYQRDASLNGWWEKLPYPVSGTSLTARYLANGHVYNFKITAINVAGESSPSNIISVMPRWADGTAASASVTSSWIFNDYQGFDPIQRYDVTASVRGTRDGDYLRLNGDWHTNNGKTLLSGIFWYLIIDCTEGYVVAHDTLAYETGPATGGGISFQYRMNPQRMYKVQVWGQGDLTYMNGIYGKFARYPARGIIPFINETACF
ncbi:fibronectin type III domain-containing protein [Micromonospora sp. DR5-3]|uniref:fibronectin type III domain-containing protein n=1 Tax=unclassified Micromonospora TaxID=2617518 RepID=UPI0011D79A8C|nr:MULTISPECIES: fibronectin type III domain-containing protein [unclassified Micromonospora]MCW3819463.1 fibronectin type III domain-containing protein [Micromonospora sp. DR5-3]TYC20757.1 S8 family serine peptidase [Micromonospora sp. MP36]